MIIPHRALSPEALVGVIEEFVSRESNDDGGQWNLATQVAQVRRQLEAGTAIIVFDEVDGTCSIVARDQLAGD